MSLCNQHLSIQKSISELFIHAKIPFTIINTEKEIQFISPALKDLIDLSSEKQLEKLFDHDTIRNALNKVIKNKMMVSTLYEITDGETLLFSLFPIIKNNHVEGIIILLNHKDQLIDQNNYFFEEDLKAIFDLSFDVIYVSDQNGKTLRVSNAAKKLWGQEPEELVGRNVADLEQKGIVKPSITLMVLEKKEKVAAFQTTSTGRRLMVVGTPIKDEKGNVIRVVNASRDITEESRLHSELEEANRLLSGYKEELKSLRKQRMSENEIIFCSREMEKSMYLAEKVAVVDSTVLILGESGVGKEVIASFIHQKSSRKDKPFIKINCGAIPESLLESELFGYESGAFTGANKGGKMGLFELASEGTLFLDEVAEMPYVLQVKLLRVLQEQEITRIGSSNPIKVNVRIIAATNRELEEEVQKGSFREDLFYRLNVVPIHIPALRERKEDIVPLLMHFMDYYNDKYSKNNSFSLELIEALQQYDWPGNVRELQNIVERLIVISDEDEISDGYFPYRSKSSEYKKQVEVNEIIPLKECLEMAEKQLLHLAKQRYYTTTEIAKALKVDQSTISRKLQKLKV
ncbi:sigma-54 interaction domain-containing protein [Psychrobacillus sp. NPDC096426]|uniref:sigma-54 interaction domain-containing protein n=1 Tax=Psychrobacillus sp. NPDC096426 TaxID=3364491 RepID=UPI00381A5A96